MTQKYDLSGLPGGWDYGTDEEAAEYKEPHTFKALWDKYWFEIGISIGVLLIIWGLFIILDYA